MARENAGGRRITSAKKRRDRGCFNFPLETAEVPCRFADAGLLSAGGFGLRLRDAITGEAMGVYRDTCTLTIEGHGCRVLLSQLEKL